MIDGERARANARRKYRRSKWGNPHARRVARLRAELLRAVQPKDVREVVNALLGQAKTGDVAATKELLQRLLGPPIELDLLERLEALEDHWCSLKERERDSI